MHWLSSVFFLFVAMTSLWSAPLTPPSTAPVLILGGGVGALTSALYLARAGVQPLVIEGDLPGGLLTQSASVQNWPGEMDILGSDLIAKMHRQAEDNGVIFLAEKVVRIDFSKRPFLVETQSESGQTSILYGEACIIAMGTEPNRLGVPGESFYWGKGVSSCAICDGSLYRDQVVGVVGGGDAAVTEALYLSNLAQKVHLFVRGTQLKTTDLQRADLLTATANVEIHYQTTVKEIRGDPERLSSLLVQQGDQESSVSVEGLFLAIGSQPNSKLFRSSLGLDAAGYILVGKDRQTSMKGIYAVGDIADPDYQQAISAAGDGAKAALEVQKSLTARSVVRGLSPGPVGQTASREKDKVLEIQSSEELARELAAADVPIVVDFYATWCPPCKKIAPRLDASADQLAGKVKFLKVNVDQVQGLTRLYRITSMPTVLLFSSEGKLTDRKEGTEEISTFLHQLEKNSD